METKITKQQGNLELKHLAPYLPYELYVMSEIGEQNLVCGMYRGGVTCEYRGDYDFDKIKPILRPMSDLTKEIKMGGDSFIPLIRLLELKEMNSFSNDNFLKSVSQGYSVKIIDCTSKTYSGFDEHQVSYPIETSNMGTLVYSFGYSERFNRFQQRDESARRPLGVGYQKQLFEQLYEWHFDLNGLIPAGLAINLNSLDHATNP